MMRHSSRNQARQDDLRWTAPEALDHSRRCIEFSWASLKQTDTYSFAMTCYENVSGKYPNDGMRVESELVKMIKEGTRPEFPETLHEHLTGLVTSCCDPTSRTADEF